MSKYDIYDEIYINAGKAIVNMKSIGRGVGEPGVALRRLSPAEEVESNGVRTRGILPPPFEKKMPAFAGVTTLLLIVLKATL